MKKGSPVNSPQAHLGAAGLIQPNTHHNVIRSNRKDPQTKPRDELATKKIRIATPADSERNIDSHWCYGPKGTARKRHHRGVPIPGRCHIAVNKGQSRAIHPLAKELEHALNSSTSPIAKDLERQIIDTNAIALAHCAAANAECVEYLQNAAAIRNSLSQTSTELSDAKAKFQQLVVSKQQRLDELWKAHGRLSEKLMQHFEELIALNEQNEPVERDSFMQHVRKDFEKLGKEWSARAVKMENEFEDELRKKRELATAVML